MEARALELTAARRVSWPHDKMEKLNEPSSMLSLSKSLACVL